MNNDLITFWTDGAYSPKKQKGGWAFFCPELNIRICNQAHNTTNNRMELEAAIKVLEFIQQLNLSEKQITIFSDSKYLVETMNQKYTKNTNLDLWKQLDNLFSDISYTNRITFIHVKGHADNENNNIADLFANLMSQKD